MQCGPILDSNAIISNSHEILKLSNLELIACFFLLKQIISSELPDTVRKLNFKATRLEIIIGFGTSSDNFDLVFVLLSQQLLEKEGKVQVCCSYANFMLVLVILEVGEEEFPEVFFNI